MQLLDASGKIGSSLYFNVGDLNVTVKLGLLAKMCNGVLSHLITGLMACQIFFYDGPVSIFSGIDRCMPNVPEKIVG